MEWQSLSSVDWEWLKAPHTMFIKPMFYDQKHSQDVIDLYLVQLAIYFVTAFSHKFFESEDRRKDYFVMYCKLKDEFEKCGTFMLMMTLTHTNCSFLAFILLQRITLQRLDYL
jgi:hypothetical protein